VLLIWTDKKDWLYLYFDEVFYVPHLLLWEPYFGQVYNDGKNWVKSEGELFIIRISFGVVCKRFFLLFLPRIQRERESRWDMW
jgi:hypothetical protein